MTAPQNPGGVQGEGDYVSARKFQADEREFVKSGQVETKAREAEQALDGPEGPELEAARQAAARGESLKAGARPGHPDHVRDQRDPEVEEALDRGLEDTFPASDPVSASPGAD